MSFTAAGKGNPSPNMSNNNKLATDHLRLPISYVWIRFYFVQILNFQISNISSIFFAVKVMMVVNSQHNTIKHPRHSIN